MKTPKPRTPPAPRYRVYRVTASGWMAGIYRYAVRGRFDTLACECTNEKMARRICKLLNSASLKKGHRTP